MGDEQAAEDPRDVEIADLRRELAAVRAVDAAAVSDPGAPERQDRAPVPSLDEMAGAMKPAALERAAQVPPSAVQKSMRQMEWAGELATSGPPKMPDEEDLGNRVVALERGLGQLAQAVADMPGQIVDQLRKTLRNQAPDA